MTYSMSEIYRYKDIRNGCIREGNKFGAAYFQALIIRATEGMPFYLYKKNDLRQYKQIFLDLLNDIFHFTDKEYFQGIYYELVLSGSQKQLTGNEKDCQKCAECFRKSNKREYVHEAYQLHMMIILGSVGGGVEEAEMYARNILKLLEVRYGTESWQYAKMRLHIIGEYCYYYKKEEFVSSFEKEYTYLYKYLVERDSFFCECMLLYSFVLAENEDSNSEAWMEKCEKTVELNADSEFYNFLKCKAAWQKARMMRKRSQDRQALNLLQDTIDHYLIPDKKQQLFYGYVYLEAANICFEMKDYTRMLEHAMAGLEICGALNEVGSELYYNLYLYRGIKYAQDGDLARAKYLFSSSIEDIAEKFGKESENYIIYMNNLRVISVVEGAGIDLNVNEIMSLKNEKLKKQCIRLLCNVLIFLWYNGAADEKMIRVYQKCMENMQGENHSEERKRLNTVYLAYQINAHKSDRRMEQLIEELGQYYANDFSSELGLMYWKSMADYQWGRGNVRQALEICREAVKGIGQEEYIRCRAMMTTYIQLLIVTQQYKTAKGIILRMIDLSEKQILHIGFGNIFDFMIYIRFLISMYIFIWQNENGETDSKETKLLLERVISCKTIEREIRSLLSQYKDENIREEVFRYNQAHRRLSAVELRRLMRSGDKNYDKEKREKYELEIMQWESEFMKKIPFEELIHEFKFTDLNIPENSICAEYFAYYDFRGDRPMLSQQEKEQYSYLIFILGNNDGQTEILDITSVPVESSLEEEMLCLLDAAAGEEEYDEEDQEWVMQKCNSLYAAPILKYAENGENIYLGLDYLLQIFPEDLMFYDHKHEPVNLMLLDSVRYIEEDVKIDLINSDALIMGNPKYCLNPAYKQKLPSLPYSEMECREIAQIFGTEAYIGEMAKQKILWENYEKNVIHISTHGSFMGSEFSETSIRKEPLIYSYLMLAGYEDWEDQRKEKGYGNGIVTGDDFLFMDLSKTDLVVLSACDSGLGISRGLETVHGMRWAIGAAGARNSVISLWEVSDCATALLMILFYRNLREITVGKALYEAKRTLRTITIDRLKRDVVLWKIAGKELKDCDDSGSVPFAHWRYWAGFVCYCR